MQRTPVAVIGAGTMGAGIAQVAARAGHEVWLVDADDQAVAAAVESIARRFVRLVEKGSMPRAEQRQASARVHPGGRDPGRLPPVSLAIEAVAESLEVKHAVLGALGRSQPPETILASNTSSLDITRMAQPVPHPERVVGLHFFNPVPLMPLVEVVTGALSDPGVIDAAAALMADWGKTAVRCASTPGFIVNRVARPFYGEGQRMVQAGLVDPATLDAALRGAGFAMGPMELTDLIGQDVNLAVGASVWEQTGRDPRYEPTAYQRELVATGRLGRKTGRGVFRYDSAGQAVDADPDPELVGSIVGGPTVRDPVARTLAMLVNEAADVAHRGVANPDDIDTAMVLGAAYPRGPFAWRERLGAERVHRILAELDHACPTGRYRASPGLHV